MTPRVAARVIGKWARTRLSGQKTLIARNYENRTIPPPEHLAQTEETLIGLAASGSRQK